MDFSLYLVNHYKFNLAAKIISAKIKSFLYDELIKRNLRNFRNELHR